MLDNEIKIPKEEAKLYPPLPEDIYQVELLDITSKEVETYNSKMGRTDEVEMETVMSFQYTLLEGKDGEEELRGRNVWHNFVPIYLYIGKNGKNNLYKIVEAFLQRDLTPEEEATGITGAFLNELIGKQCRIGTKHKASKDGLKVFDNVETYYTSKEDLPALTDEEKEDSRVKTDDEKAAATVKKPIDYPKENIDPNSIPF